MQRRLSCYERVEANIKDCPQRCVRIYKLPIGVSGLLECYENCNELAIDDLRTCEDGGKRNMP